jgi:tetratricopeptide (TPR) repeat protein
VKRLAETRVRVLPDATRSALGVVAALGEPRASVLSRALEDESGLDAAFESGVIESEAERLRFTHPLQAAAALGSLPPWRRRSIHVALAELAETPVERARHLAAATTGPSTEIAAAIEDGARDALAHGAPSAAAQLYEQAARATPTSDRSALSERLRRAGDCRQQAGDTARAFELFHRALRESPPGVERARARLSAAWHELTPIDEGLAEKYIALDECGGDLAARAECLFGITMSLMHLGDLRSARQRVEEIRRVSEDLDDLDLRVSALSYSGYLDAQMCPGRAATRWRRLYAWPAGGSLPPPPSLPK